MTEKRTTIEGATRGPAPAMDTQKSPIMLATEVERLRAELDVLLGRQQTIIELLGSTRPERILHDIRNVLNERGLLRSLAGIEDDSNPT